MYGKAILVRGLPILGIASLAFLVGCGGGTSQTNSQPPNNQPLPSSPPPTTTSGTDPAAWTSAAMAPDPTGKFGKFVYVANSGSNNVSMFTINTATGALTPIGTVAAGTAPYSVAVDPSGKFAYVVNEGSNDISMYAISTITGILNPLGPIAAGLVPTSVAVDPSGKFAYVTNADPNSAFELNTNNGNISMYTIDATTGVLASAGTIGS